MRERLHRALSVVYGIELFVILKDIWGLPDRDVERIALWMADALIDTALREVQGDANARPHRLRPPRKDRAAAAAPPPTPKPAPMRRPTPAPTLTLTPRPRAAPKPPRAGR